MPDRAPLCLLQVHAHPDDEASKGAGTTARYSAAGVRTVLVCCTGGEAGDILNPAVDTPEVRNNLHAVRMAELQASVDALGYSALHMLGYRDSGMPDTDENKDPANFANAPFDEAVARFVRIIRAERPQVIITYRDEQSFYPHPDHIRVHEISGPAFDAAGDPDAYPDEGDPWQPSKLYYVSWSIARVTRPGSKGASTPIARTSSRRSSTSATTCTSGESRCSRTERRSIRRGTGCAYPTTSSARSSRGRSSRSRARSSTPACPTASSRTTCSPGCAPERSTVPDGATVVEFVVAVGKKEQARGWARVGDDGVIERGDGAPAEPASITFTATPADAQALHDGTLDLSVGFMRGQVKMAGDFGVLLQFLPRTGGPAPSLPLADLLPG
jgi:LmbE family N-acetylglucosaminyl deacetylase